MELKECFEKIRKQWGVPLFAAFMTAVSAMPGEAGPVSYTYKDGTTRTVDTSLLWVEKGQVFLTQEAMIAIDKNGQKLNGTYTREQIAAEKDPQKRGVMLSQNIIYYFRHLADQHQDCIPQVVKMEENIARSTPGDDRQKAANIEQRLNTINDRYTRLYGPNWKDVAKQSGCTMTEITPLLKKELGLQ